MGMEIGLDTGPIYATARTPISAEDTTGSVHDRLSLLGAALMVDALPHIARGALQGVPQAEDGVTYAAKIDRHQTRIDWTRSAIEVDRAIRAFAPAPGAWCLLPDGARAKILMSRTEEGSGRPGTILDDGLLVACGTGAVRLLTVQREGKGPLDAASYLRGSPIPAGQVLASAGPA